MIEAFRYKDTAQVEYVQHAASRLERYWGKEQRRFAEEVQGVLTEGLERGISPQQMAAQLRERASVSRSRSNLIVRNELGNAAATAQRESHRAAGVTEFIWWTAQDKRVRDEHEARHGKRYSYNDPPGGELPGQPVQCRCVALAMLDTQENIGRLKFEQAKEGEHIKHIRSGKISKSKTRMILRGITKAKLTEFLRRIPLQAIEFAELSPRTTAGYYDPLTRTIVINTSRKGSMIHSTAKAGYSRNGVTGVSAWGKTREETMRISLVHELGHHLIDNHAPIYELARDAFKHENSNPISQRAIFNRDEYFCETLAAYIFYNDILKRHDPIGYRMIEEFYSSLGGET